MKTITAVDLFCGAGGSSTGLKLACQEKGYNLNLIAVNHWDRAIETHSANHPDAKHLCETLDNVDPRKAVPSGRLNLLVASPECTHHSRARGGKPMSDQSRTSCWTVVRWAESIYIERILIENVPEFTSMGPLGANERPLKSKRGQGFTAFINALEALGYRVEWKILNAADYGDPTSRKRLFIIAQRGNRKITWPTPTHSRTGQATLFETTQKWRSATEIIDWSVPGQSIFGRKKPLKPNTLKRIATGLQKYCGGAFTIPSTHNLNAPLPTITSHGSGCLVEPFLVKYYGGHTTQDLQEPLPAVTANYEHYALVEPFLLVLRKNCPARQLSAPLSTLTTQTHHALVQPYLVQVTHGNDPWLGRRVHSLEQPVKTLTGSAEWAFAQPLLIKHNKTGVADTLDKPLDTVTDDRFALTHPIWLGDGVSMDIHFRMLQPHELAAAQGFPSDYQFKGGKKEIIKQIGNAVAVNQAKALCDVLI